MLSMKIKNVYMWNHCMDFVAGHHHYGNEIFQHNLIEACQDRNTCNGMQEQCEYKLTNLFQTQKSH